MKNADVENYEMLTIKTYGCLIRKVGEQDWIRVTFDTEAALDKAIELFESLGVDVS